MSSTVTTVTLSHLSQPRFLGSDSRMKVFNRQFVLIGALLDWGVWYQQRTVALLRVVSCFLRQSNASIRLTVRHRDSCDTCDNRRAWRRQPAGIPCAADWRAL